MPGALSNLGTIFGGGSGGGGTGGGSVPTWMKLILGGLTGAGTISNILADRQRGKLLDQQKQLVAQQQANASLTPQQLAAKVSGATQPLNAGLVQAIQSIISADMAERGLSQAPGLQAAALSQGLAPYYQENQNQALTLIARQLGLPAEAASTLSGSSALLPKQTDTSSLLALLLKSLQKPVTPSGTPSPGPTTVPSPGPGVPGSDTEPDWYSGLLSSPALAGATA